MKKFIIVMVMVLGICGVAQAELEVYDANGQFLGMTDYWSTGGNSAPVWIPKLGIMMMLYNVLSPGEANFDRFVNVTDTGAVLTPEHSRLLYICDTLYVSTTERVQGFYITDQYWNPCVGQNFNPPIYSSGANYTVYEIQPSDLPFTLPIVTPLQFKYVAPPATRTKR